MWYIYRVATPIDIAYAHELVVRATGIKPVEGAPFST